MPEVHQHEGRGARFFEQVFIISAGGRAENLLKELPELLARELY